MRNKYEQMNFVSVARFPPRKLSAFLGTENNSLLTNRLNISIAICGLLSPVTGGVALLFPPWPGLNPPRQGKAQ